MGLDMYLTASKYFGRWEHGKETERKAYDAIAKAAGLGGFVCNESPSLNVELTVAYWRKANAIHKWFVDNVQSGEDNCSRYYTCRDDLKGLVDLCKKVAETRDASELPPTEGFFFGTTEIGDDYFYDVQNTITQLTAVLDDERFKDCEFYYQASW